MTLGSVGRYAAMHSPAPVVVAREESMAVRREIVVGVRDPEESAAALNFAFEEAALRGARLPTGWEVVQAHPGRVLSGASARADLVVLGRHHEDRGVDSVTYAVLSHAHGPVACVPDHR